MVATLKTCAGTRWINIMWNWKESFASRIIVWSPQQYCSERQTVSNTCSEIRGKCSLEFPFPLLPVHSLWPQHPRPTKRLSLTLETEPTAKVQIQYPWVLLLMTSPLSAMHMVMLPGNAHGHAPRCLQSIPTPNPQYLHSMYAWMFNNRFYSIRQRYLKQAPELAA